MARAVYFGYSEHADAVVNAAIEVMRERGATIVDPADIPTHGKFDDSELEVLLFEHRVQHCGESATTAMASNSRSPSETALKMATRSAHMVRP